MRFNIWEMDRVHIKLDIIFLRKINKKILSKFKTKVAAYGSIFKDNEISYGTFKNILKESYMKKFFVPLKVYIKIINKMGIKKEELQKNILAYKTAGGINYIGKPILPIKITPIFDMLLAHHIGDGTVINPGKGRLPYFGYRQFDKFYRHAYIQKIEEIFGKIKFKKNYFETSTRPYCPPVLSSLFFKYYDLKIDDFLSDRARIPDIILKKGKESMLAVLIAFIIDEGNIDSTQISIHLINKKLIDDLNKMCVQLGYKSKITYGKCESNNYYRLHILREGMKRIYKDYLLLNKKYKIIDLGWKCKAIENSFKIYKRGNYKIKGNNDKIFSILETEQLSVNQLAERLNMTRQGVRYHIHKLIRDNKIKLIDSNKLNWVYGVK